MTYPSLCCSLYISLILGIFLYTGYALEKRHPDGDLIEGRFRNRKGKHLFPEWTPTGRQSANEFQFVNGKDIKDLRGKVGSATVDVSITKVTPLEINNNDVVTVSFKSSNATTTDWIGAYSPADVDITSTTPVKYGWCDDSDTYISSGSGSLQFNMTNLRDDIKFYYFTGGTYSPILLTESSEVVSFKNPNQPLRQRVVGTGDYDVFNVLWSSAVSKTPTLRWGTESGSYKNEVSATTKTISKKSLCGSPANDVGWRDQGLIHTAALEGMKALANTKIYYKVGDLETNDFAEEQIFFVPPLPGTQPPSRPTQVILYDDMGRGSNDDTFTWNEYGRPSILTAEAVGEEILKGNVDAIYHGGDISYATGYLAVWDFYLNMLAPVAGSALYLTTVGNHETDWYDTPSQYWNHDSGGECGVMTTELLPMPAPATTNKPWWSYDVGLIHFVGMSTEHDYAFGTPQYKWLENDLKNVNRTITPWIIFGGHRAMYLNSDYCCSDTSDITVMDELIKYIEPLLWKYRVNVGFYGHNHVVQRQSAVKDKKVVQRSIEVINDDGDIIHMHNDPQATVHYVVGTAGAGFTKNANLTSDVPEWSEMVFYEWGYARVTAVNASYLDWQWVKAETGEILDHMVIQQGDPTQKWVLPRKLP